MRIALPKDFVIEEFLGVPPDSNYPNPYIEDDWLFVLKNKSKGNDPTFKLIFLPSASFQLWKTNRYELRIADKFIEGIEIDEWEPKFISPVAKGSYVLNKGRI